MPDMFDTLGEVFAKRNPADVAQAYLCVTRPRRLDKPAAIALLNHWHRLASPYPGVLWDEYFFDRLLEYGDLVYGYRGYGQPQTYSDLHALGAKLAEVWEFNEAIHREYDQRDMRRRVRRLPTSRARSV